MLAPSKYAAAVIDNREPSAGAGSETVRRILSGTQEAVAYIASVEGRKGALATAKRGNATIQTEGTGSNPGPAPYKLIDNSDNTEKLI